jgi:hypothetical protein
VLQLGDGLCVPIPIVEQMQVLVVPGSDSATVSEDLADDCGLYSPMLSPRQQGAGGSGGSSSAEDLTIELTSPTARSSDFFAPPAEMRAPALSPGVAWTAVCWSALSCSCRILFASDS